MDVTWLCVAVMGALVTLTASQREPWHRSDYPNPQTMHAKCNRPKPSFVCDPDGLLSRKQADSLDNLIEQIRNTTKCPCQSTAQCERDKRGYAVGIGIVYKMDTGANGVEDDEKKSKIDNKLHEARLFSYSFLYRWSKKKKMGKCNENVAVFYSVADNVLFVKTGRTARLKLTDDRLGHISRSRRLDFSNGNHREKLFRALRNLLWDFEDVFNGLYDEKHYLGDATALEVRGSTAARDHTALSIITALAMTTVFMVKLLVGI